MVSFSTKLHYYTIITPKLITQSNNHVKSTKFLQNQQLNKKKCSKRSIKAAFGSNGDDFRAIIRMLKLNSAIQNRSIKEFFELACDECKYFCSLLPPFDLISLSKKSFAIFCALMIRNNVTFVIKPTPDEGFDFGVKWTLAFKDSSVPLGLGCNLHTSHLFKGNMVISKANILVGSLINITSHPKKIKEIFMEIIDKILPKEMLKGKREVLINILISLIITFIYYILLKKLFI